MGYRIGSSNDVLQLKMPTRIGGCYLYIRQTGHKSKVPMACSLALIHLLKLFMKFRKPIYSHDQQFIVWTTQDQPGRRHAWDKVWGKVTEFPWPPRHTALPESPCVHSHGSSLNLVTWGIYGAFFN